VGKLFVLGWQTWTAVNFECEWNTIAQTKPKLLELLGYKEYHD